MQLQGSYTGSCPEAVARDTVGALVNRRQRLHPSSSCPRKRASRATGKVPAALDPRVRGGDGPKCERLVAGLGEVAVAPAFGRCDPDDILFRER